MKRVIVDYGKLNNDILDLLVAKFPFGYEPEDIITFRNAQNDLIEAVEVKTEDTVYLVKVSQRLVDTMDNYSDDDEDDDYESDNDPDFPEDEDDDFE